MPENDPPAVSGREWDIHYPTILPDDTDFETFRKTDPHFNKMLEEFYPVSKKSGVMDEKETDPDSVRTRYISMLWPRDPKGEIIREMPLGKMTSNGLPLWGATLYDFYYVHKSPDFKNHLSCISGSRIAKWMRENGETYALDYIKQAENEEHEPRIMHPYHCGEFIEQIEKQVHLNKMGRSMKVDKSITNKTSDLLLPPSEYPGRWPLAPFSTPTYRLQERIPQVKLPKKLIVHDPWDCLKTGTFDRRFSKQKWSEAKDITYIYNLNRRDEEKHVVEVDDSVSPESTPEAHVFITPKRKLGEGNHSYVYQVELELPRELLVKPKECLDCALEQEAPHTKEVTGDRTRELFLMKKQHAPYCDHLDDGIPRPGTARVSVTAKLTMPADEYGEDHPQHLEREALNYMRFPAHFYEHWNGYNIISPCQDPFPVGAVAPQYYGYYTPDESCRSQSEYMSPILLLEHCGVQADMKKLTLEERRECWSLLERLHLAGFAHQSVYERNIMVQSGPVQWSPFRRSKMHPRFRLIDFGRTVQNDQCGHEEFSKADKNFRLDFILPKDGNYS